MPIAVIDIGTNSTRLLIANYENEKITPIYSDLEITRIGEGIGQIPQIQAGALERTIKCLKKFIQKCNEYDVKKIRMTATSAVRDAQNKLWVKEEIYNNTSLQLEILTGEEEARLSYLGAISDFSNANNPLIVVDIGGGSTELVYPVSGNLYFTSLNVGAVRLAENPDLIKELDLKLNNLVKADLPDKYELIAVGGTATSLVAVNLGLDVYDPQKVHGYRMYLDDIKKIKDNLIELNLEQRKRVKGLQPQRADIIPYGTCILIKIIEKVNCQAVTVSEKDILYGLIITSNNGQ